MYPSGTRSKCEYESKRSRKFLASRGEAEAILNLVETIDIFFMNADGDFSEPAYYAAGRELEFENCDVVNLVVVTRCR